MQSIYFQSHHGLISTLMFLPPYVHGFMLSIPPWSDFYRSGTVQGTGGNPVIELSIPPWSDFYAFTNYYNQYGKYAGVLSIPPWSDFYNLSILHLCLVPGNPFNPTMV